MYENRVLTLAEALALGDDQEVYTEERDTSKYHSFHSDGYGVKHSINTFDRESYGQEWRVWLLPNPPTPEELAANPWPEEPDAHD